MATASSSFMVEETGACALLAVQHRIVIASIEVDVRKLPSADAPPFVVWALTVPRRGRSFADGFYNVALPVPLGHISAFSPAAFRGLSRHTALLPLGRWELFPNTRVALMLAPATADVTSVRHALLHRLRPDRSAVMQREEGSAMRWRLCGTQVVMPAAGAEDAEAEWRPLLHCRWYELKRYVREATVVPYGTSRRSASSAATTESDEEDGDRVERRQPMYAGDVKEAVAISVNGQCILWPDGGVGLCDEVKPFYRVYAPAREEKTIRVRRFPHRYADVVGEVPFGQCVEAFGHATDPFTKEQYVLLYLPSSDAYASHVSTYDLTFVEEGRYVWGWSKVAGSSGLPLLTERYRDEADGSNGQPSATTRGFHSLATSSASTTSAAAAAVGASAAAEVMSLPEVTFYTPVREGRAVRIRKRPTLTAATVREMEANEVRAAVALLTVPLRLPANPTGPAVPHVFVQWQQGGYSLLRNEAECFLTPVLLSRVPRRFPIRTRSSGSGEEDGEEVVDLSRQSSRKRTRRGEEAESADEGAELQALLHPRRTPFAAAAEPDESLLSPSTLPASLQEALRKGVVRLEDLPPLRQPGEEETEEEASTEDTDLSDDD